MTPFQGAGAGQAMEVRPDLVWISAQVSLINRAQDAEVLSTLLADPRVTRDTVHNALRAYADVRHPVAKVFYEASRRNGQLMSDASLAPEDMAAEFAKAVSALWGSANPVDNAQQALELFGKVVAI